MEKKRLYDTQGCDSLDETIIGANPSGLLNFNKSRYKWATSLYKTMRDSYWTPESVSTANEGKYYKELSDEDKKAYDLVFAQLSFNDSLVADSLVDNLNRFITNKVINACLIEQAAQEVLHSKSYAVLLADAVGNSDEVFELYKSDLTLNGKNQTIHDMFNKLPTSDHSAENILYALVANQILEGIYFLSGFSTIYLLGDTVLGSASMIAEIHRDENLHLALFENIIREFVKENKDLNWFMIRAYVNKMFEEAYKLEVSWLKYVMGHRLNDSIIEDTIAYYTSERAKAIGMFDKETSSYGEGRKTSLVSLLDSRGDHNSVKGNYFESKINNYSKQSLDMDF